MRRAGMHGFVVERSWACCLAAAIVAVGCAMPSAAAAFTASAETAPGTITYFGSGDPRTTGEIEQRLYLEAGASDERLVLTVRFDDGPSSPGALRIAGAGTLGAAQPRSGTSATSVIGGRGGCQAPTDSSSTRRYDLLLPAGTGSTISYTGRLRMTRAPTDATAFVQAWKLAPAPAAGSHASSSDDLPGTVTVRSPAVALAGLAPARVAIRVGVAGSGRSIGDGGRLVVRSLSDLVVSGSVSGSRRGDSVTIWRFSPGATIAKPLARVRVDGRGRFTHAWRPARRGPWDLYATYAGHDGLVETARSPCGGPHVRVAHYGLRPA